MPKQSGKTAVTRRKFLTDSAAAVAAFSIVPRHVLGRGFVPPSDTLNIANVGVGGMGRANLINVASQNIVALCDVDCGYAGKALDRLDADITSLRGRIAQPPTPAAGQTPFDPVKAQAQLDAMVKLKNDKLPKAKRYKDYREMLAKQKDIDAVVIATPDHMHATIASAAMDLGKHVYVQKPLTWCVAEARALAKRARETKVATQMGNQGPPWEDRGRGVEKGWPGALGAGREAPI